MSNKVIFDIDTQNDLCKHKNVVDAEIINNIENILTEALRNDIVILGSVLCHENNLYGYCTVDTDGQEKINETMMVEPEFYYTVANTRNGIDMNVAEECWQIVFERQCPDIWDPLMGQPDNIQSFLRHEDIKTVYIVGNNFNDSVNNAIHGFVARQYDVVVVLDAISWNDGEIPLPDNVKIMSAKECMVQIIED